MKPPRERRTSRTLSPPTLTASLLVAVALAGVLFASCDTELPTGPAALASITITPNPATPPVTGTQQFTAVGADAGGNVVAITPTWSVVAGGGAITSAGLFTAGMVPGTFINTVQATSGSMLGTATVEVIAGPLATISATSDLVTLAINATYQFEAVGRDAGGNVVPISPSLTWSVVAGGGAITGAGLFTAGTTLGTFTNTVQATNGTLTGSATVTVTAGALATITVTPNPAIMAINATQQFTAVGRDAGGNVVPIQPLKWSVDVGGGAIDTTTGLFTAGTVPGTYLTTVQATDGFISGHASVVVTTGALTTITVTPDPVTLPINGTQPYTAVGTDAGGNVVAITPTWSVVVGGGTINGTGLFTAGTVPGTYTNTVQATEGVISGTATVVVVQGEQTITFAQPTTPATYGSSFTIAPTASSGLTVTVIPSGGCSLSGSTVTMTSGTVDCVLTASQAGDASYSATPDVVRTVVAVTRAASVTPDAAGKAFGAADPALTGILTGFLAGDGVTATYSRTAGEAVGSYTISATLSPVGMLPNYDITSNTATFTIGAGAQTITFAQPTTPATYGSSFAIAPTASSELTVTVTPTGGCTLAGGTVTMTSGTVDCVLTATQPGNVSYSAAFDVVRTVEAATLAASVTPNAAGKAFGAAEPALTGTLTGFLAGDGVTATYSRVAGEAVGTYTINALLSPAGVLPNYSITYNTAVFTIGQTGQTVAFDQPASPATYGSSFAIAPTVSSGLPVTVTPSGGCSLSGGTVTMTSGTVDCVLTASQAGNGSYTAADDVEWTVAAAPLAASVTPNAAGKAFGAADPVLTGALAGFLVGDGVTATYTRVAGEAVGTYTISAMLNPAGVLPNYNVTYNTAAFTIGAATQTITFAQPTTPATYGSSFAIAPTASSGLTVTVTPSGGCSLSGSTVTMTSGTVDCVLTATQAGNASYTAATDVARTVVAATKTASVTPDATGKIFGTADPTLTGTPTGFLAGDGVTASYSRVAGEAVGTYTISATLSPVGVLGNYAVTHNTAAFTISQAEQTITFAQPTTPATYGSSFAIAPTASSGLTVTVTPSGGCTLSGGTVTMTSGTVDCVLTATQAGNASYTAATDVARTVVAVTRAASVTPDAAGKAFGAADPALTGTLTGFLAGDGVTATYSRTAGEAVGSYTISATLSPVGVLPNYDITSNTAAFTITPAPLGSAQTYGILAGTSVTCGASGTINGEVGVSPGATVTPGTCTFNGTQHLADGAADTAQLDLTAAYDSLAALTPCTTIAVEVGGTTLTPGVYCAGTISVTGTVTLDAAADPEATFVIRAASTLTTAGSVSLIRGAQAKNVYWLVGSSATLGAGSEIAGNILALTSITLNDGTILLGRALARNGTVVLGTGNTITLP